MFRLLLVLAVTAGMARLGYGYFTGTAHDDALIAEIRSQGKKLNTSRQRLEQFRAVMNHTLLELAEGEISLAQAIDRVIEASRNYHPIYLRMVAATSLESLVKERVGYALIKTLKAEIDDNRDNLAQSSKVIDRLKVELTAMFPNRSRVRENAG